MISIRTCALPQTTLALGLILWGCCLTSSAHAQSWREYFDAASKAYQEKRYEEADRPLELALRAAESMPATDARLADTLRLAAKLRRSQKHPQEALTFLERLLEVDRARFEPNDLRIAADLREMSWVLQDLHKSDESIDAANRALEIVRKEYGPETPETANFIIDLGDAYASAFIREAEAQMEYQHALSILQQEGGPDTPRIADVLIRLTSVTGIEYRAAVLLARRALATYERELPADDVRIFKARGRIASFLVALRRFGEAEPLLREIIDRYEKDSDNSDPSMPYVFRDYAYVLESLGRMTEAQEYHRRFQALLERLR